MEFEAAADAAAAQETMGEERLKAILESLLFAAGEPVALARLAVVLDNVPRDAIKKALGEMALGYSGGARGLVLDEVAGGYQLRTPKEHALYVRKLLAAKPPRLSRPLLETLAIIAYRQPITRPEIEQLRGVDSGGVLETLLERRLARIAGRKEAPGRPIMYATTTEFLEVFGLRDLRSLPDLEELKELEGGVVSDEMAAAAALSNGDASAGEPDSAMSGESERGIGDSGAAAPEALGSAADESSATEPSAEPGPSESAAPAQAITAADSAQEAVAVPEAGAAEAAPASGTGDEAGSSDEADSGGESAASSAETPADSGEAAGSTPERSRDDDSQ